MGSGRPETLLVPLTRHEGLRFNVEQAKQGELPRFELKAKRLQDLRPQH